MERDLFKNFHNSLKYSALVTFLWDFDKKRLEFIPTRKQSCIMTQIYYIILVVLYNIVILIFVLYNVQRITREISKKLLLNFRVVIF